MELTDLNMASILYQSSSDDESLVEVTPQKLPNKVIRQLVYIYVFIIVINYSRVEPPP